MMTVAPPGDHRRCTCVEPRRVVDGPRPIHNLIPMAKIARKTVSRRAASATARFSANYKTRSRTRIAKLVKAGRGEESFNDVARSLGLDWARGERARLVAAGTRLAERR